MLTASALTLCCVCYAFVPVRYARSQRVVVSDLGRITAAGAGVRVYHGKVEAPGEGETSVLDASMPAVSARPDSAPSGEVKEDGKEEATQDGGGDSKDEVEDSKKSNLEALMASAMASARKKEQVRVLCLPRSTAFPD